jgi:hypothetical protein
MLKKNVISIKWTFRKLCFSVLDALIASIQTYFSVKKKEVFKRGGTRWCSWSRHCATSRKVAVSILDGVTENILWRNPSGHTTALGSTQPLTDMNTRNISCGGKGSRYAQLTNLHLHVSIVSKSGRINLLERSGPVQACNGIALPLHY